MKTDTIEQRGAKFVVLSEAGKVLGSFDTRAEAAERLRQIEAAKKAKGDSAILALIQKQAKEDNAPSRRVDFGVNLGEMHFDPERKDGVLVIQDPVTKFLRVDARLTRVGVFTYFDVDGNSWGELRTEDEVFNPESMRSFEMTVVTDDHPEQFVDANNVKDVQVGSVGTDVRRDGEFIRASIVITDAKTIQSIKDGKRELSCGYTAQIVVEPGVTDDGTSFAGRQTNIRGNHVAVVDKGRAGSDCAMMLNRGDAFSHTTTGVTMKTKKIKMQDGTEVTIPVQVADAYEAAVKADKDGPVAKMLDAGIRADHADQFPPKKKGEGDDDDDDAAVDAAAAAKKKADDEAAAAKKKADDEAAAAGSTEDDADLRAKVDMLEADAKTKADTFNARVDARSRLVADAVRVLGAEAKTDNRSDAAIMRDVVLHIVPAMKSKLDAHKGDNGYLTCAYDSAMELAAKRETVDTDNNSVIFDAMKNDDGNVDFASALTTYNDRLTAGEA